MSNKQQHSKESTFEEIALAKLGISTLETRNRDDLDFHEVAVWQLRAALEAAYAAGQNAKESKR